jgi:chromosome segregation ATPase
MGLETWAVKVSEETKELVNKLIASSGFPTSKEWFETVLGIIQREQLKNNNMDFAKDLGELELHTNRINQLIINMVQRASYEKNDLIKKYETGMAVKDERLTEQKSKILGLELGLEEAAKENKEMLQSKEKAENQAKQLSAAIETHKDLIAEYKEKIIGLTDQIKDYEKCRGENLRLEKEKTQLTVTLKEKEQEIHSLNNSISWLNESHSLELERRNKENELDCERKLLAIRSEYQSKIEELNATNNSTIKGLYEQLDKTRNELEEARNVFRGKLDEITQRLKEKEEELQKANTKKLK